MNEQQQGIPRVNFGINSICHLYLQLQKRKCRYNLFIYDDTTSISDKD